MSTAAEGLCVNLRLVKLKNLVDLSRNGRFAILLGSGPDDACWQVALPGDISVFSLATHNIDFLPTLHGQTFVENIATLKKHGIDIMKCWKNIPDDPVAPMLPGQSQQVVTRLLVGKKSSVNTIEFSLIKPHSAASENVLKLMWYMSDIPLTSHSSASGNIFGSCKAFYAEHKPTLYVALDTSKQTAVDRLDVVSVAGEHTEQAYHHKKHERMIAKDFLIQNQMTFESKESERLTRLTAFKASLSQENDSQKQATATQAFHAREAGLANQRILAYQERFTHMQMQKKTRLVAFEATPLSVQRI